MPSGQDAPTQIAPRTERWLPHAIVATAFVVLQPALVVWMVVPRGEPALLALSVPLGMLLSVLAAAVGGALWKRVPGSRDLVFADLMLWGWLRRLRAERRLKHAETLLGHAAEGLSVQALSSLSSLLEARDSFTYGHSQRVTRHAERIAAEMGLPSAAAAQVRTAAALHDVGKLHTPREILNKPGRLTHDEFEVIRRHPGNGAAMATGLGDPMITAMIRHHHERLDGAGYPAGLAGEEIPIGARIIAVADTFDAMTSDRAYRRASSHKRALDVLREEAGKQLDAEAVAGFLGYYRGLRTVAWSAFATAAPQRFFAWLGGLSPGVSAGAAGAAALAIGTGAPQAPIVSPATATAAPQSARTAQSVPARDVAAMRTRRPGVAFEAGTRGRSAPPAPRTRGVAHAPRATTRVRTPAPAGTPSPQRPADDKQPAPGPLRKPGTSAPRPTVPDRPTPTPTPAPVPHVTLAPIPVPDAELPTVHVPVVDLPPIALPTIELPDVQLPAIEVRLP